MFRAFVHLLVIHELFIYKKSYFKNKKIKKYLNRLQKYFSQETDPQPPKKKMVAPASLLIKI